MKSLKRIVISVIIVGSIVIGLKVWNTYKKLYVSNIEISGKKSVFICIPSDADFEQVKKIFVENGLLKSTSAFEWVAEKLNYVHNIKPGRYKIHHGMSNKSLVGLLRSGQQSPVRLKFNNVRTIHQLAQIISLQLEIDSVQIIRYISNESKLSTLGFNSSTIIAMFIPNTYEVYWNIGVDAFMLRMNKEYKKFWNESRLKNAEKIGLTTIEISTLASIINEESYKTDEYAIIAGLYINRLKKDMPLQADPTVKFALGDFTIKRILLKHLEVNSPYNTYKNMGLPPGPICMSSVKAIDAVLQYKEHKYLYFCAKSDFSGYHVFANTLQQHNQNAKKYQAALNNLRIYK